MSKLFETFSPSSFERLRRIRASTRVLYKVPFIDGIVTGERIPAHLFNKNECKNLCLQAGDTFYVLNIEKTFENRRQFYLAIEDKKVMYAIQYEDKDGKLTQTKFYPL